MKRFLFIASALLLLTACHKDKKEEKPVQPDTQSVLVYIAGDNNLSSFVSDDLWQMMVGSNQLADDCNLLLFIDQKGKIPYFVKVEKGDTTLVKTCEQEMKTSDGATLKMAVKWMKDNYQARNYGLVLWGHASGWIISRSPAGPRRAYGQDTTGGETWMNIPDMARALHEVCADTTLRFIFADCCCFQSVESAYELRKCADYIIASAAEIPGEGAPYNTVIPALFSQQDNFYEAVADAYFDQVCRVENYNGSYTSYQEPIAVVKTSELDNLAMATRTALTQSLLPMGEEGGGYPDVSGLIYYYDHSLFDMNDFILRHADSNVYTEWKRSFDAAVPYKKMTPYWMANHIPFLDPITQTIFQDFDVTEERYGGVNMFVPQDVNAVPYNYRTNIQGQNERIVQMQWYTAAGLAKLGW